MRVCRKHLIGRPFVNCRDNYVTVRGDGDDGWADDKCDDSEHSVNDIVIKIVGTACELRCASCPVWYM